jgi:hypothetical protein
MEAAIQETLNHLFGRAHGPMAFRLVIQPLVAATFAILAGLKDARAGHPPHGWAIATDPARRRKLLRESWRDVGTVFVVAVVIDIIYEIVELRRIYPGQTLFVATVLALFPYLLIRGPANRLSRYWGRRHKRS